MKNKIILALLFLLFSFFVLAQMSEKEQVLKVGAENDIDILAPWDSVYTLRDKILWNVFEPLVILHENSTNIKPHLATSWKVSDNNRTWLIKLREGVNFHDGSSLTADDVVASVSAFRPFNAKVEKVDRLTVRFILPEPKSGFLNWLAQGSFAIAPSKTVQQYKLLKKEGKLQEFNPVGSGPFKFSRWEKGKEIILESFTNYWQGSPLLKKLVYQVIPDNKERLSAIEKGEIDVIDVIFPADLPRIKKKPMLKIVSTYGMNVCYIAMNTNLKPLNDIKVRKALNLAVDKMRLARMFYYGGYGVPTNRILSPAFWGFSALPRPTEYRPAKAKQMLAEAGYKTGFTLNLLCVPGARPYLPDPEGMALEIKRQWAVIGVKLNIMVPANFAEFDSITRDSRARNGDNDLTLVGWIELTGDPDYTLTTLLSGEESAFNDAHWNNKLFDEKLKAAQRLPLSDVRGRIRLYNEAQKIFQDEAPWIPLFHTKIFVIHNQRVRGIILYPSSMISYHKVKLEN